MKNEYQGAINYITDQIRQSEKPKFATVTEITADGLKLNLPVNGAESQKSYKRLSSYSPVIGDRVLVEWIGSTTDSNDGTYLVIGKVI